MPSMLLTCHVDHMPAPEMKLGEKRSEMTDPDADVIAEWVERGRRKGNGGEGTEEEVRAWAYAINGLKLIVAGDLSGAAG